MGRKKFEFNFWPSFADILVSLILMLFIFFITITIGVAKMRNVMSQQEELVKKIASACNVKVTRDIGEEKLFQNKFEIYKLTIDEAEIIFLNEPTGIQKIRFSEHILFPKDEYKLNDKGIKILKQIGNTIKNNIDAIRQIQIQGHADTDPTKKHRSNLNLAAQRAMTVFNFLTSEQVGISPVEHLMSATSFGEYKPVQRLNDEMPFSLKDLKDSNANEELKKSNRRIELLLFYKY